MENSAPVLIEVWMLSTPPIAGMVAVPAICSRTWKSAAGQRHGVADPLVQLGQGGRAEHDLVAAVERRARTGRAGLPPGGWGPPWPGPSGRRSGPSRSTTPVVAATARVAGQQRAGPPDRHGTPALDSVEGIVEVPPVQRRMRDQRGQAGTEGESGDDHGHGQHRPGHDRPDRHGGTPAARLQGKPQALHARGRQPGGERRPDRAGLRSPPGRGRPARCGACR